MSPKRSNGKRKAPSNHYDHDAEREIRRDFYMSELGRAASPTPAPPRERRLRGKELQSKQPASDLDLASIEECSNTNVVADLADADPDYAAAAFVLKRYPLGHEYCKVAIRELTKKFSNHSSDYVRTAKVQKIEDALQAHGVDPTTAERAAAELSDIERRSTIVSFGEGLVDSKALESFLEDLCTGATAAPVLSIMGTWLDQIREDAFSQATPALMSGGLPRESPDRLPPTPMSGSGKIEAARAGPSTLSSSQLLELQASNEDRRIAKFQERFPGPFHLFIFHVEQACARAAIIGVGLETRLLQARRIWDEADERLHRDWKVLHGQIHLGNSKPLERSIGDEALDRGGILEALGLPPASPEVRLASTQSATASDSSTEHSALQTSFVSAPLCLTDLKESLRPTMGVFHPHYKNKRNSRRVAWALDAPAVRHLEMQLSEFRVACKERFGSQIDAECCHSPHGIVWTALFKTQTQAMEAIAANSHLTIKGVSIFPEALPSNPSHLFVAHLPGLPIAQESIRSRVIAALSGVVSHYRMGRYTDRLYALEIRKPNESLPKPLLRFYVPIEERSDGIVEAYFRPVNAEDPCLLCAKMHVLLCPKGMTILRSDRVQGNVDS